MTEGEIQSAFIRLLKMNRILYWRQNLGAILHKVEGKLIFRPNPMKGFPDVCGLTPLGKFWACEVKRPGGKLSYEQQKWIHNLNEAKAITGVIYSVDEGRGFIELISGL